MFLVFGQFHNHTRDSWDWQQVGGVIDSEFDAKQFAEGFAITYGMTMKVISRTETTMYLPPAELGLKWPEIRAEMIAVPH